MSDLTPSEPPPDLAAPLKRTGPIGCFEKLTRRLATYSTPPVAPNADIHSANTKRSPNATEQIHQGFCGND